LLEEAGWRALGTSAYLFVLDGDLARARAAVERLLESVDLAYSRFRIDSELMRLQASPGHPRRVSPLLWQAITTAIAVARETDGAVDPTIGRAMRIIGYDDDFSRVAGRTAPIHVELGPVPGWQAIGLDERARTVRIPSGVELDLGSSGKALASDMAAEAARTAAPDGGVLVSLGGDIATSGRAPAGGWRILASEDSETPADAEGEVVAIQGGAMATSSTTVRRWRAGDGTYAHHLVDPRTGGPVEGPWRTVTVAADTCVAANAWATAAIVLGERGLGRLEDLGLTARLVGVDGRVVRIGGWPEPVTAPASPVEAPAARPVEAPLAGAAGPA
jgi:thiamine biosynthesis lipoprotein